MPLLSIADLLLPPSAQESFGVAALEAMACETPVVASRVGGLPEVISDGESGFLHDPDDVDGMAASAVKLLSDAALHRRIARGGLRAVHERFCAEEVVPALRGVLRRGARPRRPGRRRCIIAGVTPGRRFAESPADRSPNYPLNSRRITRWSCPRTRRQGTVLSSLSIQIRRCATCRESSMPS